MASEQVIAMVTAPLADAESLARSIVEAKLAACVHVLPAGRSTYWWEGKIERVHEQTLIIKTTNPAIDGLGKLLDENHPYEVYELLVLEVTDGNQAYLSWMTDSVGAN